MKPNDELIPTRSSLLSRLKDWGDEESWKEFFDTYWKLIHNAAIRSGLSDAEAQDVVQETVIAVAKKMDGFKYNPAMGSFKGWLLQLTRWRIADQLRKRRGACGPGHAQTGGSPRTATVERVADPNSDNLAAAWEADWRQTVMDAAIARVKRKVEAKQYQMFDLYVLKEWPVEDIVKTLGVSAYQVYKAKSRIAAQIKKEVAHLETKLV